MPRLDINFSDVPDKILPLPEGIYTLEIHSADFKLTNDGTSHKVEVAFRVQEPTDHAGRIVSDHIGVKMETRLKRLAMAAGLDPAVNGLSTEDLPGRVVQVQITQRSYKDNDGNTQIASNIKDYLIPSETPAS